jgi:uncharacterized membrane protein
MEKQNRKSADVLERIALRATRWVGSTNSILLHTLFFIASFVFYFFGISVNRILLVVTTIVSLEAIYLSIFIQMSMNRQARRLREVARDLEEINENVEDIQEDVDEIQKDVEDIQEDVEGIESDVDEISEDLEEDDVQDQKRHDIMLSRVEGTLKELIAEINELKKEQERKQGIKKD